MTALRRITKAAGNPMLAFYHLRAKVNATGLFRRYDSLARRAGFKKLYFILSFDCDTREDIEVVEEIHDRLGKMGVTPVYAVPGELLERGAETYRKISNTGAEFINHGNKEHTYFDEASKGYASCFFYDQIDRSTVRADIEQGDAAVTAVLGKKPAGFRTPHFGTFQRPDEMRFLHSVLKNLDYKFSTSSLPYFGFRSGPVFRDFGLAEFPVSGSWSRPLAILDSWGCYDAPQRTMTPQDYVREGTAVAEHFEKNGIVGLLNFYADPSHIAGEETFFQTVEAWAHAGQNISYRDLMKEIHV